jgi:hypothetical protein
MYPQTLSNSRALYVQLLSIARDEIVRGVPEASLRQAYGAGMQYYLPIVAGFVGAMLAMLGVLIGKRTAGLPPLVAGIHRWGAAVVVIATVVASQHAARVLSIGYGLRPEVSSPMIAIGPALFLLALLWSESMLRVPPLIPRTADDR